MDTSNTTNAGDSRVLNPERTIEELLGFDTAKLLAMTSEELDSWIGDALTRQEEALAHTPAARTNAARTRLGLPSKVATAAPDFSKLPPELAAIAQQAQALLAMNKQGKR